MDETSQSDGLSITLTTTLVRPVDETAVRLKMAAAELESLDYDNIDSTLEQEYISSRTPSYFSKLNARRWVITAMIGILTGLVAFAVEVGVEKLTRLKFWLVVIFYQSDHCDGCFWSPYLILLAASSSMVAIAAFMAAFISPVAKGSGIPEIKCYLNGVKVNSVLRLPTLIAKAIGVTLSVSAGMVAGKEGPMIHCGAIIAGGITQGKSTTIPFLRTPLFAEFRNDTEKRDFVSSGAAAGVAAAFGAPIGGVLFSLEEGASFWNQQLTWRTFFCSMVASFTLNFFKSGTSGSRWGSLGNPGLLNFGDWNSLGTTNYTPGHWLGFLILGIMGGLFGSLFNAINTRITLIRQRFVLQSPWKVWIEAILVMILTSTVFMLLAYNVFSCKKIQPHFNIREIDTAHFGCPEGYFNDMAALILADQETAIRRLFHYDGFVFSLPTLGIFFIAFFLLATVTYGVGVPSSAFVPALLAGAAYGRFLGHVMAWNLPSWDLNPGIFALIGAASMLGGLSRMTIALCVILVEATGQVSYGMPIMISLMLAKFVGDYFNGGLDDIHIHLKHIPLLEWDGPLVLRKFSAQHVMSQPVICFSSVENVGRIYSVLQATPHNGFPITTKQGQILGLILRSQLITLLKKKSFQQTDQKYKKRYEKVEREDFKSDYPRFPPISDIDLTATDKEKFIDLTHFMHLTPYVINYRATLLRVFQIFRTMGLRHLIVVKGNNKVVGIITRKDLVNAEESISDKKRKQHLVQRLSDTDEESNEQQQQWADIGTSHNRKSTSGLSTQVSANTTPKDFEQYTRNLDFGKASSYSGPKTPSTHMTRLPGSDYAGMHESSDGS